MSLPNHIKVQASRANACFSEVVINIGLPQVTDFGLSVTKFRSGMEYSKQLEMIWD
jgi:hypothetical protein